MLKKQLCSATDFAYPALFPPTSHVLSGHTSSILSVALQYGKWALTGILR